MTKHAKKLVIFWPSSRLKKKKTSVNVSRKRIKSIVLSF